MKKSRRLIPLVAVLMIGISIHVSCAWAEGNSPTKVVKDFASAYFMLNPSMAEYLSQDARTNENDVDMVELYLRLKALDAYDRGYQTSYLQMHPLLMKTKVLSMDDSSATIQLNTIAIRSINPLYRIVGYIFGLIEEHTFQGTLLVVKENDEWKIGPGALGLPF